MTVTSIQFRRATPDDVPAIVALIADDQLGATREDPGPPLHPDYTTAFDAIGADPNQLLAVADDAGQIAGCLQLTFIPGLSRRGALRGQIEAVRIAASHRGRGLGHDFMTWAIGQCRERNCRLVQLTTDKTRPEAHAFYERLGFTASHEGMKLKL
ncbi:MAG: GNAT family N-acetyltransferase [Hyphomicrobiaceae bacterium]